MRYYDPEIGRYITRDPAGYVEVIVNVFIYVGNNPVNGIDPLGLTNGGEEEETAEPEAQLPSLLDRLRGTGRSHWEHVNDLLGDDLGVHGEHPDTYIPGSQAWRIAGLKLFGREFAIERHGSLFASRNKQAEGLGYIVLVGCTGLSSLVGDYKLEGGLEQIKSGETARNIAHDLFKGFGPEEVPNPVEDLKSPYIAATVARTRGDVGGALKVSLSFIQQSVEAVGAWQPRGGPFMLSAGVGAAHTKHEVFEEVRGTGVSTHVAATYRFRRRLDLGARLDLPPRDVRSVVGERLSATLRVRW